MNCSQVILIAVVLCTWCCSFVSVSGQATGTEDSNRGANEYSAKGTAGADSFSSALPQQTTIVVCPIEFDEALQPWIELREAQGFNITVIRPSRTAYALAEEIKRTAKHRQVDHLVLVGDAYNEQHPSRAVPTDYIRAVVNVRMGSEPEIATDKSYGDFTGNGMPDIPIGRISVRNSDELTAIVDKIICYEQNTDFGTWRRRIDFTAGTGGFSPIIDRVIETTAKQMITELIPGGYETTMTFASWTSPYCPDPRRFSQTTIDHLNRGGLFWVYIGHGHPLRLDHLRVPGGRFPIFEMEDCAKLNCVSTHPIGLMLSCYTNAFDFPDDCLGELLIRSPGGPIAIIGGTRVTMPYAMSLLSLHMMEDYFDSGESRTLGELFLGAKRRLLTPDTVNPYRQMIETMGKVFSPTSDMHDEELVEHIALFHILGDPLLSLHRPSKLELETSTEGIGGQSITVSGNSELIGTLTLEMVYPRDRRHFRPIRRKEFTVDHDIFCGYHEEYLQSNGRACVVYKKQLSESQFKIELQVPADVHGEMVIRAHVAGDAGFAMGHTEILIQRTTVTELPSTSTR